MGPSRARSVFSRRRRHETDASPPLLRPYIRIFVIKHAFPALAALAAAKGASFDDDASRRRASFPSRPRSGQDPDFDRAGLAKHMSPGLTGPPEHRRRRDPRERRPGLSRSRRRRASDRGLSTALARRGGILHRP
jgi:hypothetical protein